jgi:hypothetical protein
MHKKLIFVVLIFLSVLFGCSSGGSDGNGKDYSNISEITKGDWNGSATQTQPEKVENGPVEFSVSFGSIYEGFEDFEGLYVEGDLSYFGISQWSSSYNFDKTPEEQYDWQKFYLFPAVVIEDGTFSLHSEGRSESNDTIINSIEDITGEFTGKATCVGTYSVSLSISSNKTSGTVEEFYSGTWIATAEYSGNPELTCKAGCVEMSWGISTESGGSSFQGSSEIEYDYDASAPNNYIETSTGTRTYYDSGNSYDYTAVYDWITCSINIKVDGLGECSQTSISY